MGYDVGDTRTLEQRTFDDTGALADPSALTLDVTDPTETLASYSMAGASIDHDGDGLWHKDILFDAAGVWRWLWTVTSPTGTEVEAGAVVVGGPRNATPWVGAEDIFTCSPCSQIAAADRDYGAAALAALAATELLYLLSNRLYPGIATVTVRPCHHSAYWDQPGWLSACTAGWLPLCGCGAARPAGCRCYTSIHPVDLGGGILDVHEVLIDGDPFTDYRLDKNRWLVRTDHSPWPSAQDLTLADTEDGTWSVTYSAGRTPPSAGVLAARALACEMYQGCSGGDCQLPPNIASLTSQGEAIVFADPADLKGPDGKVGIWVVDKFLEAERYGQAHLGTVTVSPDVGPRAWTNG